MQPFSRETITDRRQPHLRWTAVIAGALVALGTWMLLQLLLTGGALSAIDANDVDKVGSYGIGTSIGSVAAPLIAMFIGGLVGGRLASTFDRKMSAFHGALVWTITSILGLALLGSIVSSFASQRALAAHTDVAPAPEGAADFVDSSLDSVNVRMKNQNAPTVDKDDFLEAARFAVHGRPAFDRAAFVARLDDNTSLSRPEAEAVLTNLGDEAGDVAIAANQLAHHRERALQAANDAGNALLAAGVGLLLCLIAAVGGALLGGRLFDRNRGQGPRSGVVTEPMPGHTTAQYPNVTAPNEDVTPRR